MSGLTVHDDFERFLVGWLDETAGPGSPGYLDETLTRLDDVRQRPAWLSPGRWLPMRTLTMQRYRIPRAAPLLVALALLIALAIAALAIVGSRQTRLPPPFGVAATGLFVYDSGGDLFVTDPDGSGARPIVSAPGEQFGATFSRDGTRLAYWSRPVGQTKAALWISDADGAHARSVTGDLHLSPEVVLPAVDWSPDSSAVVFAAEGNLYLVGADGSNLRSLGDDSLERDFPLWSPDGTLIAFHGQPFGRADLQAVYVIGADGTNQTKISESPGIGYSHEPTGWSPDSTRVIFSVCCSEGSDIHVSSRGPSGWVETPLISGPTTTAWARFSTDGTRISYLRAAPTDHGYLVIANADGTNKRQLQSPLIGWSPHCWAPDDRSIVAVTAVQDVAIGDEPNPGFVILSVDGSVPPTTIPTPDRVAFAACSWQRLAL